MKKKIIIIGAGVSGLACGIFAQKNGFETVIYEKNHFAGGNLTGWQRKGCYIDNCIHWLNGSNKKTDTYKLWMEIGAFNDKTEFYQSDSFYVSEHNGVKLGLGFNLEETQNNMLKLCPEDEKQIRKFINCVKLAKTFYYEKGIKNYLNKLKTLCSFFVHYQNKTIEEICKKIKSFLLKKLLSDYIPPCYSIYVLLLAYASFVFGDGKVLKEGSLSMAKNIANFYEELGGKIEYNKSISQINLSSQYPKVIFNDGTDIADYIVCACDAKTTFNNLIDYRYMPKIMQNRYNDRKSYPLISSFHIAFKITVKQKLEDTLIIECPTIKIGSSLHNRIMIKNYSYAIKSDDNGFVLQVFIFQKEEDFDFWNSLTAEEYRQEKDRIVQDITNILLKKFKKFKNNIEFLDCWTPISYNKYFNSYKGSYMSFGVTKKFILKKSSCKLNLQNIYMASQWQTIFGGLPNALSQGNACIMQILKDEKHKKNE